MYLSGQPRYRFGDVTDAITIANIVIQLLRGPNRGAIKTKQWDTLMKHDLPTANPPLPQIIPMPNAQAFTVRPRMLNATPQEYQQALALYQKALLPWFQNVLTYAPPNQQTTMITAAENVLRAYNIDPATFYQALANQLGVQASTLAPTIYAQSVSTNATAPDTSGQAAQQQALQTIQTQTALQQPPAAAPAMPTVVIPTAQQVDANSAYVSPPTPAPAPIEPAPTTGINWDRWAMPLAVLGAALLNMHSAHTNSGAVHHGSLYQ